MSDTKKSSVLLGLATSEGARDPTFVSQPPVLAFDSVTKDVTVYTTTMSVWLFR